MTEQTFQHNDAIDKRGQAESSVQVVTESAVLVRCILFLSVVLEIVHRALHTLGTCSTLSHIPRPNKVNKMVYLQNIALSL